MKKQMKYCIIGVCICICICTCICIYTFHENHKLMEFYPSTQGAMYDLNMDDLEKIGIQKQWVKEAHAMASMVLVSSESVFLFHCKQEYEDLIIQTMHLYVDTLKKQYAHSDQIKYISDYQEYLQDGYYVLVISEKADDIIKEVKAYLS